MIYDYNSVMMVFENYVTLSHGKWPDPKADNSGVRRPGVANRAPFENPCIMAAEIGRRVIECGTDGTLVELVYGMIIGVEWGVDFYSERYKVPKDFLFRRINEVAWYCTDEEYFKRIPYRAWKRLTHGNDKYQYKNTHLTTTRS